MSRPASFVVLASSASFLLVIAACSGGQIAVGKTEQQLQTKKNGQPTGNGQTCSWDDTVAYDVASGKTTTTPAPNGPYTVGQDFKALDGCNDCTCTAKGIMCTVRSCTSPSGQPCTNEAKVCPDGSSVGRTGPSCEFAACPTSSCDAIANAARADLDQVIGAHASCTTDADCVETARSADCFDSCSGAVNQSSLGAVDAARDRINGFQCKQFAAQGCKKTVPPCVPPTAPRCHAGSCE